MPKKRQRCANCQVCKFLKSIGGFGEGDSCRKIRCNAKKAGKDTVCKGNFDITARITPEKSRQQHPVRKAKRVAQTGSGSSLTVIGRQSLFCKSFLKERKRQRKNKRRLKDLQSILNTSVEEKQLKNNKVKLFIMQHTIFSP